MTAPPSPNAVAEARALRALRHRDHTRSSLDAVLARAELPEDVRTATVDWACSLGYVDDERFALRRAERLADRGVGDRAIVLDLERQGVEAETVATAVEALEPERVRAARIVERRGPGPATARHLARRGFSDDVIELAIAYGRG